MVPVDLAHGERDAGGAGDESSHQKVMDGIAPIVPVEIDDPGQPPAANDQVCRAMIAVKDRPAGIADAGDVLLDIPGEARPVDPREARAVMAIPYGKPCLDCMQAGTPG